MTVAERAYEFWKTLPHCISYPNCDGDLEGMRHSQACPLFESVELNQLAFAAKFAEAERRATLTACLEQVGEEVQRLLNARHIREQINGVENSDFFHEEISTCERIATRLKQLLEEEK